MRNCDAVMLCGLLCIFVYIVDERKALFDTCNCEEVRKGFCTGLTDFQKWNKKE